MRFIATEIPDVVLIRPQVFGDPRGFFLESWQERKFAAAGITASFVQDNHSRSTRHTLRGLHYQLRHPQGKLVRVVAGSVYDVAVDIRRHSPHFGRSVSVTLSADNHDMLWVPAGFAHGFLVLSESADFLYRCTDFYAPEDERAILWSDAELAIAWPLAPGVAPVLSGRDAAARSFRDAECYP